MKTRFFNLWEKLRSSYWFIPTLMMIAALGLSSGTVALDEQIDPQWVEKLNWLHLNEADGARALLSTVAGSMITVAGVVFSITIVALTLATSQYGPQLLRNFMRDQGNQFVLGTFIATFLYCLLVLRTIRGAEVGGFVPHLSVTVGVGLAIVSICVLVYFIHHVSESIHVSNVIASVGHDLTTAIDRVFPEEIGQETEQEKEGKEPASLPQGFDDESSPIESTGSGYLQAIDSSGLLAIATENDLLLRVVSRPGEFVAQGGEIVVVYPGERINEELASEINALFILGAQRTDEQDALFPVTQLVEIAARALSPGVNDPFTAMSCVDWLGAGLCRLAGREIPSRYRYDDADKLRVIAIPVDFSDVVGVVFDPIRQYGRSSKAVTMHLLQTIARIMARTHTQAQRAALLHQANLIERGSREGLPEASDQRDVNEQYQVVVKVLKPTP